MNATITIWSKHMIKFFHNREELGGLLLQPILWVALFGVGMGTLVGRVGGSDDDLPLFRVHTIPAPAAIVAPQVPAHRSVPREPEVQLPSMPPGEEVVNDYRFLEMSLRAHPTSFLRPDLARRGHFQCSQQRPADVGVSRGIDAH